MAGAVLGEWGADVVKIAHPTVGDPYRGTDHVGAAPDPRRGRSALPVGQPGQAVGRRRRGPPAGPSGPDAAGGGGGRVRHQRAFRCPGPARHRRGGHPGRQPGSDLRPGHRLRPSRARRRPGRLRHRGLLGPQRHAAPADAAGRCGPARPSPGVRRPGRRADHRRGHRDGAVPPGHDRRAVGVRRLAAGVGDVADPARHQPDGGPLGAGADPGPPDPAGAGPPRPFEPFVRGGRLGRLGRVPGAGAGAPPDCG
jgi:hypothetical protein